MLIVTIISKFLTTFYLLILLHLQTYSTTQIYHEISKFRYQIWRLKMNIGYIRNSRLIQSNSVSVQSKMISDFCKTNDIKLDKIIVDEGISGSGDKTDKRDGYKSVLDGIKNDEIKTLVVISISRWGRNLGEIYKSVQLMEQKGVKFLSIKESIDTSSPYGLSLIHI